ncbi:MAG TPA: biliverdin-producing heme oxygenase [Allosphingosinicella sp.]|jgi:heme oxygenase
MSARAALRAGTAAEHERVDSLFGQLDLSRRDDYRLFLQAQAAAFLPTEAALDSAGAKALLPDWSERRRSELVLRDLAALGAAPPPPEPVPALSDTPAILGTIYVLEGSRLGGALLRRSVAPDAPQAFLSAPQPRGGWRKLLETLDHYLYETAAIEAAVEAARRTFARFEAGGRRFLEKKTR